jgi:hypothetical protein
MEVQQCEPVALAENTSGAGCSPTHPRINSAEGRQQHGDRVCHLDASRARRPNVRLGRQFALQGKPGVPEVMGAFEVNREAVAV